LESRTIAAIATPIFPSGIGVIRISGPDSLGALQKLTGKGKEHFLPRVLKVVRIYSSEGEILERCLAVFMPGPRSYTGEDVVEIHCHGSPPLLEAILNEVLSLGIRLAGPGEFTKRAFLNGKLDLSQAEAILSLVQAPNITLAKAALKQLEGEFSQNLFPLEERLTSLLALLEGALDFPEDVEVDEGELRVSLKESLDGLEALLEKAQLGDQAARTPELVIVGKPNVGKSSLLNALLGKERAIVTPIPGTTRDSVEEELDIGGQKLRLVDTAGLGKAKGLLENLGQKRTRDLLERGDLIIFLVDISSPPSLEDLEIFKVLEGKKFLLIGNKVDLREDPGWQNFPQEPLLKVSALTGHGLEDLRDALKKEGKKLFPSTQEVFFLSLRQREALSVSREAIKKALESLGVQPLELICEEVRAATRSIFQLTGREVSPRVIEEIFSRFCVGK
jgi:tRNA modification GTPase